MTLTVDDLRGHVESNLGDDELGLLLDAAYEAIDRVAGPADSVTELLSAGSGDLLMLSRPASAITSVTEYLTELEDDDYALVGDQMLRRLNTGTNPRSSWYRRVEVTYVPLDDANERDRVAISLVNLELNRSPGVESERVGDHAVTFGSGSAYAAERDAILGSLSGGFFAR